MKRLIVCLLGLSLTAPAQGQNGPLTFSITARPAVPPVPALKYMLLPEGKEQTAGNALTSYYKAFSLEWWGHIQRQDSKWHDGASKALEAPLDKMPPEYRFVKGWKMLLEVDRGARMDHCDWELLQRLREDGYATILPDAQSMRTLALFLALRVRYELADGEIDKAIYSLQTGFSMGRHAGEGPTLIHMLIGVAISQMMSKQLDEVIQHPKCPNLYWALAAMPHPYIDIRKPLNAETIANDALLPEYDELRKGPVSVERAQHIMDEFVRRSRTWGVTNWTANELMLQSLAVYPKAKLTLIAKGRAAAEVEAMPVAQVLLLNSMEELIRMRDDVIKWMPLPIADSEAGIQKAVAVVREARGRGDILPELVEVIPAVEKTRWAAARADRRIAILRVVEAIRLYAAQNDGKLPAKLADVTEVPIPLDPVTGKAFEYSVKDGTAKILGPAPAGTIPTNGMLYEVTIKK